MQEEYRGSAGLSTGYDLFRLGKTGEFLARGIETPRFSAIFIRLESAAAPLGAMRRRLVRWRGMGLAKEMAGVRGAAGGERKTTGRSCFKKSRWKGDSSLWQRP
jgi:hypothetical protein